MLVMTYCEFARVDDLFLYKKRGFKLETFPGYTLDQWGIKAHNRPWIEDKGLFSKGQKIIEVGGAYSLLPKYLSEKYELEAWVGDDFGIDSGEENWSRWGNPYDLPNKYPMVKYIFKKFGLFSSDYTEKYFDRIFSVSTLEHIPNQHRLSVFKDIHRCLASGGKELHTIDIEIPSLKKIITASFLEKIFLRKKLIEDISQIWDWIEIIRKSGVKIACSIPSPIQLLDRRILVESPDVVYRFYPPNDSPKSYNPSASLLVIIEDQ